MPDDGIDRLSASSLSPAHRSSIRRLRTELDDLAYRTPSPQPQDEPSPATPTRSSPARYQLLRDIWGAGSPELATAATHDIYATGAARGSRGADSASSERSVALSAEADQDSAEVELPTAVETADGRRHFSWSRPASARPAEPRAVDATSSKPGAGTPRSAAERRRSAEKYVAERLAVQEGALVRDSFVEAGAHLWLAEEVRLAAELVCRGPEHALAAVKRLIAVCDALESQAQAAASRQADGVEVAQRSASCLRRSAQLRDAAASVLEHADASHGAEAASSVSALLLRIADSEAALARSRARMCGSVGGYAHEEIGGEVVSAPAARSGAAAAARERESDAGDERYPVGSERGSEAGDLPVARRAATSLRRRLLAAREELLSGASSLAEGVTMVSPPPPGVALMAARTFMGEVGGRVPSPCAADADEGELKRSTTSSVWSQAKSVSSATSAGSGISTRARLSRAAVMGLVKAGGERAPVR